MSLPATVFPVAPGPAMATPAARLPEMTLRSEETLPPIVLSFALPVMLTPSPPLASAALPAAFVPIKLPSTTFRVAAAAPPGLVISTPSVVLPEMTLRATAIVPPIVLAVAPEIDTPIPLARASVPAALVPISFPSTITPEVFSPLSATPSPGLPEITFPCPAVDPPIVMLGALLTATAAIAKPVISSPSIALPPDPGSKSNPAAGRDGETRAVDRDDRLRPPVTRLAGPVDRRPLDDLGQRTLEVDRCRGELKSEIDRCARIRILAATMAARNVPVPASAGEVTNTVPPDRMIRDSRRSPEAVKTSTACVRGWQLIQRVMG